MDDYVKFSSVVDLIKNTVNSYDDIASMQQWVNGTNFTQSLYDDFESDYEIDSAENLLILKLQIANDLIKNLNSFEDYYKELQLEKFKQLKTLREATDLFRTISNFQKEIGDDLVSINNEAEIKHCAYFNCDNTFTTSFSSKMYCSEGCRQKAKKWRRKQHD